jgi:hypothetical protein
MSETEQQKARLASLLRSETERVNEIAEIYAYAIDMAETMVGELNGSQPAKQDEVSSDASAEELLYAAEDIISLDISVSEHTEHTLNSSNRDDLSDKVAEFEKSQWEIRELLVSLRETLQEEAVEEEERWKAKEEREAEARRRVYEEEKRERQERREREEAEREAIILSKLGELKESAWEKPPSRWGLGRITYVLERTLTRLVSEGKIFSHQKTSGHVMRYALMPFVES